MHARVQEIIALVESTGRYDEGDDQRFARYETVDNEIMRLATKYTVANT